MQGLFEFIFNNMPLLIVLAIGVYFYKNYKDLKEKTDKINLLFEQVLDKYLSEKITHAKEVTDRILEEYNREDTVSTEISRFVTIIDKGISGRVNDKVETSNAINKFKLSKKIDYNRFPSLLELNKLGTFTEEDMESLDNGVALARREYNAQAFRYNEKASGFPIQYVVKLFGLNSHFVIFDAPKSKAYEEAYEVFDEQEPEINTISVLNRTEEKTLDIKEEVEEVVDKKELGEINIEHSDLVLKPSIDINDSSLSDNKDN